jgi:type I restriction enzyme S subunit
VPLPPIHEQERIVAEADRLVSVALQLADGLEVARLRAERLRQSILKWAFEGRLVDQDPNDEPATALLKRLNSRRDAAAAATKSRSRRRREASSKT